MSVAVMKDGTVAMWASPHKNCLRTVLLLFDRPLGAESYEERYKAIEAALRRSVERADGTPEDQEPPKP
jgi:hypothetical protein